MLETYSSTGRRLDPVREMRRAQSDLNRFFGGLRFFPRPEFPLVNLWASTDGVIVTAEVPGVSPDDLDVAVHQNTVALRGTRNPEPLGEGVTVQRQERSKGQFSRNVVLPFRVDAERVSARFDRGVLTLELPRPEADKPHHIKVARA